jgi:ATP-dependent helicase/nuclease subunit A
MTAATPRLTQQQEQAITTRDVSVALSAGAGCGKTFVLTQRFLAHLAPGEYSSPLHRLVAITFTDKAAREMRDRIREACHRRLIGCPAEEVDHWLEIVRDLEMGRISTIHSFCTTLLRRHALEAGLDPGFAVVEPVVADRLRTDSVRDVVFAGLADDDEDVHELVYQFGLEGLRRNLSALTIQRFRADLAELAMVTAEGWIDRWRQIWTKEIVPRLVGEFRESTTVRHIRELLEGETPTNAVMAARCEAILNWLSPEQGWPDPVVALTTIQEQAKVQGGGTKASWSSPDVYEGAKTLLTNLRSACKKLAEKLDLPEEDLNLSADITVRLSRLALRAANAYEEAKRQASQLDFDDLLLRARNLLRDVPDVSREIGDGLDLLMVDEFQDTDPVQADLVKSICGRALTSGKLFLVGDAKQSIYRFRRADPRVFEQLRKAIPDEGRLPLTRNFRSRRAVLNFVNAVFREAMGDDYEALVPDDTTPDPPVPCIEFLLATEDVEQSFESSDESEESEQPSAAENRSQEARWIARRIGELLADSTPRIRDRKAPHGVRPVEKGDICLLFRALTDVAKYETALREAGIDYYLVGGRAFFAQQEVYDLTNLCRCVVEPDDEIALIGVLRSPLFNLSDDTLHALSGGEGTWWQRLHKPVPPQVSEEQADRVKFAGWLLAHLRRNKDRWTIRELLDEAVRQTGYEAALLLEFLGERKLANLRKLLTIADDFDAAETMTIADFAERLGTAVQDQLTEELAATQPERGNVVRLMSIHQSKGLEFPVVFVVDMDRVRRPSNASAIVDADLGVAASLPEQFTRKRRHVGMTIHRIREEAAEREEHLRLLYVATTRAADLLILSAGLGPSRKVKGEWLKSIERVFSLDEGLPRLDPLLGTTIGAKHRDEIPSIRVHREPPEHVVEEAEATSAGSLPWQNIREWVLTSPVVDWPATARQFEPDTAAIRWTSPSTLEGIVPGEKIVVPTGTLVDLDQATELGTLMHQVLEGVDFRDPESWRRPWEMACRRMADVVSPKTGETVRRLLEEFAGSTLWDELAECRNVLREMEFVLRWPIGDVTGNALIQGRIDLVAQRSDGVWWIVDYKTGQTELARTDAELCGPYAIQLGIYALALEALLPNPAGLQVGLIVFRPRPRFARLDWLACRDDVLRKLSTALSPVATGD